MLSYLSLFNIPCLIFSVVVLAFDGGDYTLHAFD